MPIYILTEAKKEKGAQHYGYGSITSEAFRASSKTNKLRISRATN
jgi:hypothetical protein